MINLSQKKVLACVVTYNRCTLLQRCLHHLNEQSLKPEILIINNSSTDSTLDFLTKNNVPHLTQDNLGSAGGWWRAIKESIEREFDYVWLMDDDGFPDHHALELLLGKMNETIACVSSVVVQENNRDKFVFGFPKLNENELPVLFASPRKYHSFKELNISEEGTYPFAFLFNGALINLKAASEIGNINKAYFLYGDEVDYFFRMKAWGSVFTYFKAIHYHPDVDNRVIEKNKVYYFIRNTIILNSKYYDQKTTRDIFTIGVALYRIGQRNGILSAFSYVFGGNAKYFYNGIIDGINKKLGKRY